MINGVSIEGVSLNGASWRSTCRPTCATTGTGNGSIGNAHNLTAIYMCWSRYIYSKALRHLQAHPLP